MHVLGCRALLICSTEHMPSIPGLHVGAWMAQNYLPACDSVCMGPEVHVTFVFQQHCFLIQSIF